MSTRDMERVRALLKAVVEAALETAMEKAHYGDWRGMGLRDAEAMIREETDEVCMALVQVEEHKPATKLHALKEGGNLLLATAFALDANRVVLPLEGDLSEEKESVA